jgi:hypothetical protein
VNNDTDRVLVTAIIILMTALILALIYKGFKLDETVRERTAYIVYEEHGIVLPDYPDH